jgi:hypothetical protein
MKNKITVNTQHGRGGPWVTDFDANIGPRNLMAAVKEQGSGQRGVGGYLTNLQIGDVVIDRFELQDLTLEKAKMICENPTHYAPPDFDEVVPEKRAVGRPVEISGRKVNTYLDAESIAIATTLGNGNVSEGIRKALKQAGEEL